MAGGGVVMKDGSVAEKVEKTSATDADLIEERAAFEQRPKEGRYERRKEGRGMRAVTTTTTRTDATVMTDTNAQTHMLRPSALRC